MRTPLALRPSACELGATPSHLQGSARLDRPVGQPCPPRRPCGLSGWPVPGPACGAWGVFERGTSQPVLTSPRTSVRGDVGVSPEAAASSTGGQVSAKSRSQLVKDSL